jgi:hypothetical protein
MPTREEVSYRRKWVAYYVERHKPVTVTEVADMAHDLAIPSLPDDPDKTYWIVAKDMQILRRSGAIEPGAVIYRKLK